MSDVFTNSGMVASVHSDTPYVRHAKTGGRSMVFVNSQMFPARDGLWLIVDWLQFKDGTWSWYVTECV